MQVHAFAFLPCIDVNVCVYARCLRVHLYVHCACVFLRVYQCICVCLCLHMLRAYACTDVYGNVRVCVGVILENRTLVLAFNLDTRERLLLATSTDTGHTWRPFATLDTGHEAGQTSDAYPTVIVSGSEVLTVWSTYDGGSRPSYNPDDFPRTSYNLDEGPQTS